MIIVEFESEEANRAWRMHPQHRDARRKAKEAYYESYSVQICEVKRTAKFERTAGHAAAEWPKVRRPPALID